MMRLGVLLLFALAACAGPGATASDSPSPTANPVSADASEVPASDLPASGGDELSGVLGADSIEGGCAYLETKDGTRYEVIYPQGYEIDRSRATLSGPSGDVIASAGDVVTVRGHDANDMASICMIGPIFQASEVVSVE